MCTVPPLSSMLSPRGFPFAFYQTPVHCLRRAKSYFLLIFMKAIKAKREIKRKRGASAILTSRDIPRVLPCTFFYMRCRYDQFLLCFTIRESSMLCQHEVFHALPPIPCSAPPPGILCSATTRSSMLCLPPKSMVFHALPHRQVFHVLPPNQWYFMLFPTTRSSMLCP
jgi:hypothetical protein